MSPHEDAPAAGPALPPAGASTGTAAGHPGQAAPERAGPLRGPRLGLGGWARWGWRQLTSMRTALFLLLLIAVAAVPGSMLPQRTTDPVRVNDFIAGQPLLGAWLDRFALFDVFVSPWFVAIYLLLVISLAGCIVPRIAVHVRALRGLPPRTPARLERLPAHVTFTTPASADEVLAGARAMLSRGRFRLRPASLEPEEPSVSAEGGYLRETGNIAFHLGVVVIVIALAWGYLCGWKADRVVLAGQSFTNAISSYDTFAPGPWVSPGSLSPFTVRIDSLNVQFSTATGSGQFGQARDFSAQATLTQPGQPPQQRELRVNGPLHAGDASVYLLGNGYAHTITVRDASGQVLYRQATPFLPQDDRYTSAGAIKVVAASPEQLGVSGMFLPTARLGADGPESVFPGLGEPALVLTAYRGNLSPGRPQSVYSLDTSAMSEVRQDDGSPLRIWLTPGHTVTLPGGLGSISMDAEVTRWAGISTRHDPGKALALAAALVALGGLVISLTIRRRRVFVRVVPGPPGQAGVTVHVAGLARGEDPLLGQAITRLAGHLARNLAAAPGAGPLPEAPGPAVSP